MKTIYIKDNKKTTKIELIPIVAAIFSVFCRIT